jgi:hypothetical protein
MPAQPPPMNATNDHQTEIMSYPFLAASQQGAERFNARIAR